jgi:hypothetical protein
MSADFEKETATSTAKSLVGALVALGSGFVFMVMGMVAITANNARLEGDKSARAVVQRIQADVLSCQAGAVQVAADKASFSLRTPSGEVAYKVTQTGDVTRVAGATNQRLARLKGASFDSANGLLRMTWASANGQARASWALHRWGKAR